jgi:transposase
VHDCKAIEERLAALEKRLDKTERENERWRRKYFASERQVQKLSNELRAKDRTIAQLKAHISKQDAEIAWLKKQVFGQKTESKSTRLQPVVSDLVPKKTRGKQLGAAGFGRKLRIDLPVEEIEHFPPEPLQCQQCLHPFVPIGLGESSEELSWQVKLVRKRHLRPRFIRTCDCADTPSFTIAPPPPKLIPKGLFAIDFLANVLLEKYWLQRPLNKVCEQLASFGLDVSQGSLTSSLKRLLPLFRPLYDDIVEHCQLANRWQMDETHWKIFVDHEGKKNHTWWMWVALTTDACAFVIDPSRSSQVPQKFLENNPYGILTSDRYSAYQSLPDGITNSFCWAHFRRDFINLRDGYPELAPQAQSWLEIIGDVFHDNRLRIDGDVAAEQRLRKNIRLMEQRCKRQLNALETAPPLKKVLISMQKHWQGLTVFVDCPIIPMDNNECERRLRDLVVGRKNYYGSGALWSAELAVCLFSLFQTLDKHNLDMRGFLTKYLESCAAHGGKPPPNARQFLPWNQQTRVSDVVH